MAMFGTVVTLLLTLLVTWGLTKRSTPFVATYQYFNMSVAFSGPTNFQTFGVELVLHVDHLTVVALLAIEICMIAAIGWHQVMGRTEPGAARFHAVLTALLFAFSGILMSWDLAELFGFWAIGGALTYLLLAHRWGVDEAASRARVALALPFVTDLSLLCGIAWLYARYGTQNLNTLLPILHTNPGWTVRSLVVGSVLLFIGIAGRLALWPLSSWITQTAVTAPAAASALAQSAWSVVAVVVLYRLMPIVVASNQQTIRAFISFSLVAAIAGPLLGLLGGRHQGQRSPCRRGHGRGRGGALGDAGDADAARGIGLHLGQVEFGGDAGELADRVQVEVAEGPAPRRGRGGELLRDGPALDHRLGVPFCAVGDRRRWTAASSANRYPKPPSPVICPTQTGARSERCRNSSRAAS